VIIHENSDDRDLLPSRQSRSLIIFILIVILALALRLGAIYVLGDFRPPWLEDWEKIAHSLVDNGTFELDPISLYGPNPSGATAFIPPLYPGLIASMMMLFGSSALPALRILQALISTAGVFLMYPLGQILFKDRRLSFMAMLGAALFPPLIAGVVEINPGSLEVFFLELTILLALMFTRRKTRLGWLFVGVSLGIGALLRTTILIITPAIILHAFLNAQTKRLNAALQTAGLVLFGAIIIISPWTLRNYLEFNEFIPVSTNGGINFWIGNNPQATGEFIHPNNLNREFVDSTQNFSESERDSFFYRQGLLFIRNNPSEFIRLLGQKTTYFFWSRPNIGGSYSRQEAIGVGRTLFIVANGLLLPFWIIGFLIGLPKWRQFITIYGAILGIFLLNILFFVGTRYKTPAAPYQLLFATYAVILTVDRISKR
jgi:4-amino-4-deoxy-L-arabinose transferase-like glycosyltransferase